METKGQVAAGYARYSTVGQGSGETMATQTGGIVTFCKAHGLELTKIYTDEGISGATTDKRPGFLQLLKDAKAGKFNHLVIHSLSRFSRSTTETITNYDLLVSYGVKLIFLKESIDASTPTGKLFRNLLASFSEWERDLIRERMLENRTARWKRGGTFVGRVPFGYVWNREKKRLEINPKEADLYRRIVRMYVHEGLSFLDIGTQLHKEGFKCGKKPFSRLSISYILKNPIYYGECTYNRHEYDGNRRTGKMKPDGEHITFEVPAIISKTEWDAIQNRREHNRAKSKRSTTSHEHWLRDSLICDECGARVKPHINGRIRKDGSRPRYYACLYHTVASKKLEAYGRKRCPLPTIKAEEIEAQVWQQIIGTLTFGGFRLKGEYQPSDLETLVDPGRYDEQLSILEATLRNLEAELKIKERAKSRVMAFIECDDYDPQEFRQKLTQLRDEIATLKSAIVDVEANTQTLRDNKANSAAFMDFVRDNQEWLAGISEELNNLSPEDKKIFVESLIPGKIAVGKGWEAGSPPWTFDFKLAFNSAVFERFSNEGKLKGFKKNDPDYFGAPRRNSLE